MNTTSKSSPLLLSILAALGGCSAEVDPPSPPLTFDAGGVGYSDAGGVGYTGSGCYSVTQGTTECLPAEEVDPQELRVYSECDVDVTRLEGEGMLKTLYHLEPNPSLVCCYPVTGVNHAPGCTVGRPYFERGVALMAPVGDGAVAGGAAASGAAASGAVTDGAVKDEAVTARGKDSDVMTRGAAWALAGSGEHASVAAFARLSLQLMAVGAPTELLTATHQAAIDEVKHAEACWELARRFGWQQVNVGEFPFSTTIDPTTNLSDLAVATLREGCLAETLGAHLAAAAAERTTDVEVKRVLTSIADEEARHSVLSFRIVAWALQAGGPAVREAVSAALAQPWPRVDINELAIRAGITREELAQASSQGVAHVIVPAVSRLMA